MQSKVATTTLSTGHLGSYMTHKGKWGYDSTTASTSSTTAAASGMYEAVALCFEQLLACQCSECFRVGL